MAESTLSILRAEVNRRVAYYLGWQRRASASEGLSANQDAQVNDARIIGERDFLTVYDWSFLHPRVDFVLWSSVAVNAAVTVAQSGGTTLTATGGTPFRQSMIGHSIVITGQGTKTITAYTSSTVVEVSSTGTYSGATFSIAADGIYRLPDDFGGMEDRRIRFVRGYGQLGYIDMKARNLIDLQWQVQTSTGPPIYAATDAVTFDGTGQRFNLLVAPVPDRNYTASFRYHSLKDAMADGSYVIGGMPYSEALACCCLNAAERTHRSHQKIEEERRDKALRSAIAHDQRFHEDVRLGPTTWSWMDQESSVGDRIGSFQIQDEPVVLI